MTVLTSNRFWQIALNTATFTIGSVGLTLIVGLGLALLLNQRLRFRDTARTILFTPTVLSGAAFDDQRPRPTGSTNHWFAAYDVRQFTDPARLAAEVRALRERIQGNPPRRGFDRVYAPGDIENENARDYLRNGIPFEQFTLDELDWVAEHTGIRRFTDRQPVG